MTFISPIPANCHVNPQIMMGRLLAFVVKKQGGKIWFGDIDLVYVDEMQGWFHWVQDYTTGGWWLCLDEEESEFLKQKIEEKKARMLLPLHMGAGI
jgi:hypothetical protein